MDMRFILDGLVVGGRRWRWIWVWEYLKDLLKDLLLKEQRHGYQNVKDVMDV